MSNKSENVDFKKYCKSEITVTQANYGRKVKVEECWGLAVLKETKQLFDQCPSRSKRGKR